MDNKQPVKKEPVKAQPAKKTAAAGQPVKKTSSQAAKKQPVHQNKENQPAAAAQRKKKRLSKRRARRMRRIRNGCIALFSLLLIALIGFHMTCTLIGGQVYPLSSERLDLRGRGVAGAGGIARLTGLKEALLSGNELIDVSSLASLTACEYIDLTGNPVTDESYAQLRAALPFCLILCEARDNTVTELALGGRPLPDVQALMRVFAAHSALKTVDLRGTQLSQQEIDSLCDQFPRINFVYSAGSSDTLVVSAENAAQAAQVLSGVNAASHVTVTGCAFSPDEYRSIREQFAALELDCMIDLYGVTVPCTATEIDLRRAVPDESLEENLRLLPGLQKVILPETLPTEAARLRNALGLKEAEYLYNGSLVSPETAEFDLYGAPGLNGSEFRALMEALPNAETVVLNQPDEQMLEVINEYGSRVFFIYEATAFGQTFSTQSDSLDFGDAITDENVSQLCALLDRMPALKEVLMFESKLSRENMDMLFDGYPEIFFGFTFKICDDRYIIRSDVTAFSTKLGSPSHVFTQEDFLPLRYCKNLLALDLGHNAITNLDFLYNFPDLRLLILADNQLTDISPIASLSELEYLEIFLNRELKDYSPLSGLTKLTDLNVRCTKGVRQKLDVNDFLPITSLKRLWATKRHFTVEEVELLRETLPGCEISVTSETATADGWRETDIYWTIVRMFDNRVYEPIR